METNQFLELLRMVTQAPSLTQTGLTQSGLNQSTQSRVTKFPIDVINDEKTIYIYGELPGIKKEDIKIDFYNNKLTVKAEKKCDYEGPEVAEIKYFPYERVITLPICVTSNRAVAVNYNNGVLKIVINKLVEEENKFSVSVD